eukprot:11867245-Ditylum_brightwellii.AAC.1
MPRWTKNSRAEKWLKEKLRDGSINYKSDGREFFDDNQDIFGGYKYPTFYRHFKWIRKEEVPNENLEDVAAEIFGSPTKKSPAK